MLSHTDLLLLKEALDKDGGSRRRSSISKRAKGAFLKHLEIKQNLDKPAELRRTGGCEMKWCNCTLFIGNENQFSEKDGSPCLTCGHWSENHWETTIEVSTSRHSDCGGSSGDEGDDENEWEEDDDKTMSTEDTLGDLDWYFVWYLAGINEERLLNVVLTLQRRFRNWRWKRLLKRIKLSDPLEQGNIDEEATGGDSSNDERDKEEEIIGSLEKKGEQTHISCSGSWNDDVEKYEVESDDSFVFEDVSDNDDNIVKCERMNSIDSLRRSSESAPSGRRRKGNTTPTASFILHDAKAICRRKSLPPIRPHRSQKKIEGQRKERKKFERQTSKRSSVRKAPYSIDIFSLARRGNERDVLSILDMRPTRVPIDARDDRMSFGHRRTLLIIAAAHCMNGLMYELIKRNADINLRDSLNRSALFYAVRNGNIKGTELLLGCNASVNFCDSRGMSMMDYAKKEIEAGNCEAEFTLSLIMLAHKQHGGLLRKRLHTYNKDQQSRVVKEILDFSIAFDSRPVSHRVEDRLYVLKTKHATTANVWDDLIEGICFESSGEVFCGSFRPQEFTRVKGTVYDRMGTFLFDGTFNERNERHGNGRGLVYTRQGQGFYVGDFENNLPHGNGSMRLVGYLKTPSYIGKFHKGERHGIGTVYNKNGKMYYRGTMQHDGCTGNGTLFHCEYKGAVGTYKGDIIGSLPYGFGQFFNEYGVLLYEGSHVDEVRQGQGQVFFPDRTTYKGDIVNGVCTGKGIYYLEDQTPIEGHFTDAILIDPLGGSGGWRRYPMLHYGYSEESRAANRWFACAASGDAVELQKIAEDEGFYEKINLRMPRVLGGMTALHVAMRFGREECVCYLVYRGNCDLNVRDAFGRTPLMVGRMEEGFEGEAAKNRRQDAIIVLRNAFAYREDKKERAEAELKMKAMEEERKMKEREKMAYLV